MYTCFVSRWGSLTSLLYPHIYQKHNTFNIWQGRQWRSLTTYTISIWGKKEWKRCDEVEKIEIAATPWAAICCGYANLRRSYEAAPSGKRRKNIKILSANMSPLWTPARTVETFEKNTGKKIRSFSVTQWNPATTGWGSLPTCIYPTLHGVIQRKNVYLHSIGH